MDISLSAPIQSPQPVQVTRAPSVSATAPSVTDSATASAEAFRGQQDTVATNNLAMLQELENLGRPISWALQRVATAASSEPAQLPVAATRDAATDAASARETATAQSRLLLSNAAAGVNGSNVAAILSAGEFMSGLWRRY